MAAYPETGQADMVLVHLADVPERKRWAVAERLIRFGGLTGVEAMDLKMAALVPTQNPAIEVTKAEAKRVLG